PQTFAQQVGRRLQIDDEIRRRHVLREQVVQLLIDEQLVVVEIQVRVDLVALEQVIAHRHLAEKIRLPQLCLLTMAREREEELGLERRARASRVEVGKEWIVGVVENDRGFETCAKTIGQRGFAHTGRPFDGQMTELHGSLEYKLSGCRRHSPSSGWSCA